MNYANQLAKLTASVADVSTLSVTNTSHAVNIIQKLSPIWDTITDVEFIQRSCSTILRALCVEDIGSTAVSKLNVNDGINLIIGARINNDHEAATVRLDKVHAHMACLATEDNAIQILTAHFCMGSRFQFSSKFLEINILAAKEHLVKIASNLQDVNGYGRGDSGKLIQRISMEVHSRQKLFELCKVGSYDEFIKLMGVKMPRLLNIFIDDNVSDDVKNVLLSRHTSICGVHNILITKTLPTQDLMNIFHAGLTYGPHSEKLNNAFLGQLNSAALIDGRSPHMVAYVNDKYQGKFNIATVPNPFSTGQ